MTEDIFDTIVIGSGPAGLTAAIYASRGNLKTLVLAGVEAGGQLNLTSDVEDFPGFSEGIQGPQLMMNMRAQAERLGAQIKNEDVEKVDFSSRPFKLSTDSGTYMGKTIIIATGANAKWLGIPSEQKLIGKGVSACAVCDGPFFRGKRIVVVGGGDAAMKEALFLSKFGSEILVVHRRDRLKAFPALQDRAFATENIKFVWDSVIEEVLGESKVEGVKIKNLKTQEVKVEPVGALFVAVGHKPNTEFLKKHIDMDEKGYIKIQDKTKTSVEGVFAAGDVHDFLYQQAVTAAAAGCMAAIDAEEYLEAEKSKKVPQTADQNLAK